MIQGCVDSKDKKCPIADKCLRRDSANCAPPGVTLIVAPFEYIHVIHDDIAVKCEYFVAK